jgi:hypothetical protein
MELSKQEMELLIPFPVIESKKHLWQKYPHLVKQFQNGFRNRKWNYLKRKWNYFNPFQSSNQKTSLTKLSPLGTTIPKWFSKTGNGIIFPFSSHWIKQLL